MHWWYEGMGGWGWGLMTVSMVLFWVLLIVAIVALVRYLMRAEREKGSSAADSAERLLAERYARGDIDAEQYRERLATLRTNRS